MMPNSILLRSTQSLHEQRRYGGKGNALHEQSRWRNNYVKSSGFTQKLAALTQPIVYKAAQALLKEKNSWANDQLQVLNVADLGCAFGPNTFTVMSTVIESTVKTCSELGMESIPEIQFYLNDLVGNDFNTLFKGLSIIQEKCKNVGASSFAMGAPGSFHARLFPTNSMHLVHSSFAVHWLSKVPKLTNEEGLPLNKGKIYISKTSPPQVRNAYLSQFEEDFLLFLKCRSSELVADGRMVLTIHGRRVADPTIIESTYVWEFLADAISSLVSQGEIDEEKLDSFNVPYYTASQEEVVDLVEKEGSFTIVSIDTNVVEIEPTCTWSEPEARNIRSITESMVSYHFGAEVMDKIYDKVTDIVVEDSKHDKVASKGVAMILELKRKKI